MRKILIIFLSVCTFSKSTAAAAAAGIARRSQLAPWLGKRYGPSAKVTRAIHHVQNHTLLGYYPPASQVGRRRAGPAL
jgi:hypothetical protein